MATRSVILVAAGSSRRMGFNKLLAPLAGVPVLQRSLQAFDGCDCVDEIILVAGDEVREAVESWKDGGRLGKVSSIVAGGSERHFSVRAGLDALDDASQWVAVHDGARPLISREQIQRCFDFAARKDAAACARPVTETLKRVSDDGRIVDAIERTGAWVMETPQVFSVELLKRAYERVLAEDLLVTDEVSAVQHLDHPVYVVENSQPNPKITFPSDLNLAERFVY